MFRGMNLRQAVLDGISIALCLLTIAAVLILWPRLPEQIAQNFDGAGNVTRYGGKGVLFALLGVMVFMTGSFSALVRIPAVFRNMNSPWPIPWARMPLAVSATKDFLCLTNLLCTLPNVYLVYASVRAALRSWLLWLPYGLLAAVLVWYFLRMRKICKG